MKKERGKSRRIVGLLLCIGLFISLAVPACAAQDIVRVAVTGYNRFLNLDSSGATLGYAAEYLNRIASYTGWRYDYVQLSQAEALDALNNHEIDLLPGLQKTAQREEISAFSEYNMGQSTTILCTLKEDTRYNFNDFAGFSGMRIGELKGSACADSLRKQTDAVGVAVSVQDYDSEDALHAALDAGEVDAALYTRIHQTDEYKTIASFQPTLLYFGINAQNEQLKVQLDSAMASILSEEPYYCARLDALYYKNTSMNLSYTVEETEFIRSHPTITVALSNNLAPMEYYDEQTGTFSGFTVRYFQLLAQITGLNFTFVSRKDMDTVKQQAADGEIQMIGIIAVNGAAPMLNATETDAPYINTLSLIHKQGHENNTDTDTLAIQAGYPYFRNMAEKMGYTQIAEYETVMECAMAVKHGKADALLASTVVASAIHGHAYFEDLASIELDETEIAYCFGVFGGTNSQLLLDIINKGIRNLPEEDVRRERLSAQLSYQVKPTLIDRVYENKSVFVFTASMLILLVFLLVTRCRESERASEIQRLFEYVCSMNEHVIELNMKNRSNTEYAFKNGKLCRKTNQNLFAPNFGGVVFAEDKQVVAQMTSEDNIRKLVQNKTKSVFEARLRNTDGSFSWKIVTIDGMKVDRNHPCNCMLFIRDVQELKDAQEESKRNLTDALMQAEHASQAKGDFMSRMSHEIRTPLNAIIGYLEIARDENTDREKINYCIEKSQIASRHLLSIINDVLDISSIESGRMKIASEDFDIKQMVKALTVLFYAQAKEKGVRFEVHLDALQQEWLKGDELRVRQVLLNLLSNAVKFTPEGGSVTLDIHQLGLDRQVGNQIRLEFQVRDTGIGMSQEYMNRMFQPFEQESASTARNYGGTGLGLSISRNLIHMMGGNIHVNSKQGEGTTFIVTLAFDPAADKGVDDLDTESFKSLKVLVVDDEPDTCSYVKKLFDRLGVQCDTVTSGKKALRRVTARQESDHPYDLCIIDWCMKEMDGVETAKEVRKACGKKIPIMIATAYDYSGIVDEAKAAGVDRIISKPLFQSTILNLLVNTYGKYQPKERKETEKADFSGTKLLLAEDNEMNMEIALDILRKAGLTITPTVNGQEALNTFEKSEPGTFDAILMDIQMPIMDGYTASRKIRESDHPQAKSIPIIAMTANAFTEDVTSALAAGMNDHVSKPVSYDRLFKVLSKVLRKQ